MKIENNIAPPNFKKIHLTKQESQAVNQLYREYKKNKSQDIIIQLLDIYTPKIKSEYNKAFHSKKNLIDYKISYNLHLNLQRQRQIVTEGKPPVIIQDSEFINNIIHQYVSLQISIY